MQYKQIISPSFPVFCLELAEALKEGYKLDEDNLPHASFTYYEAVLISSKEVKDDVVPDPESLALFKGIHASKEFTAENAHDAFAGVKVPVKRVGRPSKQ